jgi:enoyl-[acyl-carrier-protein] reductase (NADH)
MSLASFCGRHPLATLLMLSLFIFGTAAIASTAIQSELSYTESNPHRIPDHMNPKSAALAKEIAEIKYEIKEGVAEMDETVHTVAFQGRTAQSQPILDYTTGTSN